MVPMERPEERFNTLEALFARAQQILRTSMFRHLLLLLVLLAPAASPRPVSGRNDPGPAGRRHRPIQPAGPGRLGRRAAASPDSRWPTALDAQANKLARPRATRADAQGLEAEHWRDAGQDRPQRGQGAGRPLPDRRHPDPQHGRFIDTQTDFWINQFGADGFLASSQHMVQDVRLKNGILPTSTTPAWAC
jgi:hypothetical protein